MGIMDKDGNIVFKAKSVEQGAATSVWAAVASELEGKGPLYLEDCSISELRSSVEDFAAHGRTGHFAYALDEAAADKLWELSEKLISKHN